MLSGGQQRALDDHLSGCPGCSALQHRMAQAVRAMRALPEDRLTGDLWVRIRSRLPERPSRRWAWVPGCPRPRWSLLVPVAAGVAALSVFLWPTPDTRRETGAPVHAQQNVYLMQCVEQHAGYAAYGGARVIGGESVIVERQRDTL